MSAAAASDAGGRLAGKVALITGMAAGIGRATFELFAAQGARVMGCDVRTEDGEAAVAAVRARGGGSIANVSSVHAFATTEGVAAYAAAKGGVLALSRQMALDLACDRIRVNAVIPGAADTGMLRQHATLEGKSYEVPCVGVWLNMDGWPLEGDTCFTVALEPCTGFPDRLDLAIARDEAATLPPSAATTWTLHLELGRRSAAALA